MRLNELDQKLQDPLAASDNALLTRLCEELAEAQHERDTLYERWSELEILKRSFDK